MSYILDALKKAEAERTTGAPLAPRLPQPAAAMTSPPAQPVDSPRWRWMIAAALTSVLALASIGYVWLRPLPQPAVAVPAKPVENPIVLKPQEQPAAVVAQQEQQELRKAGQEQEQQRLPTTAKMAKAAAKKAPSQSSSPASAAEAETIIAMRDVPDAIRQQIPPLKVGGYIYSTNKAERSVLINNRLLAEGDEAAPGLILERMQPDGMVMRFRGIRYRMNY